LLNAELLKGDDAWGCRRWNGLCKQAEHAFQGDLAIGSFVSLERRRGKGLEH
jgi:hypothetical protein